MSQLHLVSPNHVQTNDKIKDIQVDELNRDHSFKIAANRHRDLDRTHGKLRAAIAVLDRDTPARRFKTQLVDKERFTTEGRGGATIKGTLVPLPMNAKRELDQPGNRGAGLDDRSPIRAPQSEKADADSQCPVALRIRVY